MELIILTTSDIHGYLTADSYINQSEKTENGYTRAATVIEEIRKESRSEVLYIETGDLIQGSPLATYLKKAENSGKKIINTINIIQPDVGIIGNHEFNYGLDYLEESIQAAEYPIVCANILKDGEPAFGDAYEIIHYGEVKVGVVGVTTQYIPNWEREEHIEGLEFQSALEACEKYVPILKNEENCDAIIVAYHGGYERSLENFEATEKLTGENEGSAILASGLPIDALVTGHQHRNIAQIVNGIATLQPGVRGESVGRIVLNIQKNDENKVETCDLIDTSKYPEHVELKNSLDSTQRDVQNWLDQPLGKSDGNLKVKNILEAQKETHPYINLLNNIQMEAMGTDISAIAIFSEEVQGFNKNITMRDIINNYPFSNTLTNVKLTGKEIKDILEFNANYFSLDENGEIIINPSYLYPKKEMYNYDMFSGIEYVMDITKPVGERIVSLTKNGEDISKSDQEFIVTTNNYRASGGGNFPHYGIGKIVKTDPREVQELLIESISQEDFLESDQVINYKACNDLCASGLV